MRSAIHPTPTYPVERYEEDMFDYRKDLDKYDAPHLRRMNERPGMFSNWKQAAVTALIWGLLVGLFGVLFIWAIQFGLSIVGLL